jgi:hypothetical protein
MVTNLELDNKTKALPTSNKCAVLVNADQFHSGLTLAALMIGHHFSISAC